MDGIETAMNIRSLYDLPIIFISGYQEEKLIERAKSVGSSTYLIKPIQPKDIELAVDQALQNRAVRHPG